jgi:hypothetical protein
MSRRYDRTDIAKVGFWSALVALAGAVGYIVSVPLQVLDVVSPSQDSIIAFASSLIIATPFVLAMLALHYVVPEEKKFWTHAAVLMAVIYTTYNTLNYVVQLATVHRPATRGPSRTNRAPSAHSVFSTRPHTLYSGT